MPPNRRTALEIVRARRRMASGSLARRVLELRQALGQHAVRFDSEPLPILAALCDEDLVDWETAVLEDRLRHRGLDDDFRAVFRVWTAGERWTRLASKGMALWLERVRNQIHRARLWLPETTRNLQFNALAEPAEHLAYNLQMNGTHLGNLSGRKLGFPLSRRLAQTVAAEMLNIAPEPLVQKLSEVAMRGGSLKILRPGGAFIRALARRTGMQYPSALVSPVPFKRNWVNGFSEALDLLAKRADGSARVKGWLAIREQVTACHVIECTNGRLVLLVTPMWMALESLESLDPTHVFLSGESPFDTDDLLRKDRSIASFAPARPWYSWGPRTAHIGGSTRLHIGVAVAADTWLEQIRAIVGR